MEPRVKMKIKRKTVTDFLLRYNPQIGAIHININTDGSFGKPVDESKKEGAIVVRIEAKAEDADDFHILLVESFEYEFEQTPEDYEAILNAIYNGTALPEAADDLDNAMIALGKTPIKIKDMLSLHRPE